MSKESAIACFIKLKNDQDFANKVKQAQTRAEREEIIKNAGFDFTHEDWNAVVQEDSEASDSEDMTLSDKKLEGVTGGFVAEAALSLKDRAIDMANWF
ncbi:MAG: Nif11-like leader peptide family natural product precursor [Cyanobacteria bacterium P01_A01_bin.83]